MTRTARRIEAPPGSDLTGHDLKVLTDGQRPGTVATFTDDDYRTWADAMKRHREAWRNHHNRCLAAAERSANQLEEQGRAAGWWPTGIGRTA